MSLPYQNVLLTPRPAQSSSTLGLPYGLGATDVILTVLTLLTIYTQFMADNQQYHFQTYKQHVKKSQSQDDINVNIPRNVTTYKQGPFDITWTPKDAQRGFITKGLWAWSRHPNFACEMTFWALQGLFPLLSASFGSVGAGLTVGEKRGMVLPSPIIPAIAVSRSRDFESRPQEVR
jgi:steroid 5-alpha reductase family enzyme